jgi:hypothetical protein
LTYLIFHVCVAIHRGNFLATRTFGCKKTLVHSNCECSNVSFFVFFLICSAWTPLMAAADVGNAALVFQLYSAGADPNITTQVILL